MRDNLKKPCNQCPFRKKSLPGWLGDASPEQFMATVMQDHEMPCHSTVDYSDPRWRRSLSTKKVSYCKGSLIFFANICKLSRDRDRPTAEPSEDVFRSPQEFLNHHKSLEKKKP